MADIHLQLVSGGNIAQRMAMLSTHVKAETRRWLIGTKKKFIGQIKGKVEGSYQRVRIGRRTRKGSLWEKSIRHAFTGHMTEQHVGGHARLELNMGMLSKKTAGFIGGIKLMSTGGTIMAKNGWMPIPIYQNVNPYRHHPESFVAVFRRLKASKDLTYTRLSKTGAPMLFAKAGRKLLFYGKSSVVLPDIDYKFLATFYKTWPKELQFGRNRIARAIKAYEGGYVK